MLTPHGTTSTKIFPSTNGFAYNNNIKLAIIPECNAETRCDSWLGALNGQTNIGCGVNVLSFISEIDSINEKNLLNHASTSGEGTPFQYIVNWFNEKLKNINVIDTIIEMVQPIHNKSGIELLFYSLDLKMTPNSCTIVKLNRHPDPSIRPNRLTPGHYVLISKDSEGFLWTYEPITSTRSKCDRRKYPGHVSDNFVKSYQNQGYITASLLGVNQIHGGMVTNTRKTTTIENDNNTTFSIPKNIVDDFVLSVENTIVCTNKAGIKQKTRRTKEKRRRTNKIRTKIRRGRKGPRNTRISKTKKR